MLVDPSATSQSARSGLQGPVWADLLLPLNSSPPSLPPVSAPSTLASLLFAALPRDGPCSGPSAPHLASVWTVLPLHASLPDFLPLPASLVRGRFPDAQEKNGNLVLRSHPSPQLSLFPFPSPSIFKFFFLLLVCLFQPILPSLLIEESMVPLS